MHEEAEKILLKAGQFEMLNKFYQDSGKWQKALEVAEKSDRIHLRSTNYNYAKHLESKFDVAGAIAYYEKSGTSRFEVPRLLFEDWNALENYVNKSEVRFLNPDLRMASNTAFHHSNFRTRPSSDGWRNI